MCQIVTSYLTRGFNKQKLQQVWKSFKEFKAPRVYYMPGKLTNQPGLPKTVQVWALKAHCPRKLLGSGQTEKATHPTAGCHRAGPQLQDRNICSSVCNLDPSSCTPNFYDFIQQIYIAFFLHDRCWKSNSEKDKHHPFLQGALFMQEKDIM